MLKLPNFLQTAINDLKGKFQTKPVRVWNHALFYNKADYHVNVLHTKIRGTGDVVNHIVNAIPGDLGREIGLHRENLINLIIKHEDFTYDITTPTIIHRVKIQFSSAYVY